MKADDSKDPSFRNEWGLSPVSNPGEYPLGEKWFPSAAFPNDSDAAEHAYYAERTSAVNETITAGAFNASHQHGLTSDLLTVDAPEVEELDESLAEARQYLMLLDEMVKWEQDGMFKIAEVKFGLRHTFDEVVRATFGYKNPPKAGPDGFDAHMYHVLTSSIGVSLDKAIVEARPQIAELWGIYVSGAGEPSETDPRLKPPDYLISNACCYPDHYKRGIYRLGLMREVEGDDAEGNIGGRAPRGALTGTLVTRTFVV